MQEGPQMQDSDSDVVLGRDVKSKNNSVPLTAAAQAVSAKNSKFQEAQHASLFDLRDLPARMPVDRPERSPVVRQPSEEQHQPHLQHGHSNKKTLWSCCVRPKVEGRILPRIHRSESMMSRPPGHKRGALFVSESTQRRHYA